MSSNNEIEQGDLVAVVRGHACTLDAVGGIPFGVERIHQVITPGVYFVCQRCGFAQRARGVRFVCDPRGNSLPLPWLKKFPPLDECESIDVNVQLPVLQTDD